MAGSTKPCLFCGQTGGKLTKEHVYPRWLHRGLNIRGDITYSSNKRPVRVVSEFDVQVRDVCEDCNNGWLHDLERSFRAVMIAPMNGLVVPGFRLPDALQLVVALWAVKTWLLLEQAMAYVRGEKALEPQPHLFRYLFNNRKPPPGAQVWIGAVDALSARLISFVATRWVGAPPNPPVGIAGVFTIGCVLFQVYLPISQWGDEVIQQNFALGLGPNLSPFLNQIWPYEIEEVSWPPSGIFSAEDLERIWPSGGHIQAEVPPSL